jgi:hypothetical protein
VSDELIALAHEAMNAAYAYWEAYQKENHQSAVVWLRNDETGHLLIFTRGEYSQRLLAAVPGSNDIMYEP